MEERRKKQSCKPDPEKKYDDAELERAPRFSVLKHASSRLHYDFRLEVFNEELKIPVLLSWAIPKGPSIRSGEKRLAVQVEDHSLKYLDFEGVFEEGQYGAGKVIVWDIGYYIPLNSKASEDKQINLQEVSTALREGSISVEIDVKSGKDFTEVKILLHLPSSLNYVSTKDITKSLWLSSGSLEFFLIGNRLKGRYRMLRFRKERGIENWLLIKGKDEWAGDEEITNIFSNSVLSGKSVEEVVG